MRFPNATSNLYHGLVHDILKPFIASTYCIKWPAQLHRLAKFPDVLCLLKDFKNATPVIFFFRKMFIVTEYAALKNKYMRNLTALHKLVKIKAHLNFFP